ncbi:MAG TPA: hypothetical protein VEY71_00785, partial [Chitinophagales bacterium]|nr:hypothetical protein [Chitinophagales bacterium]
MTVDEFLSNYRPSWAKAFMWLDDPGYTGLLHPEAPYYIWCVENNPLYTYEQEVLSLDDGSTAVTGGYTMPLATGPHQDPLALNTTNMSSLVDDPCVGCDDPCPGCTTYTAAEYLDAWMADMVPDPSITLPLTEFVFRAVHCPESLEPFTPTCTVPISDPFTFGCVSDRNTAWAVFRSLYLSKRSQLIDLLRENYVTTTWHASNATIGDGLGFQPPPGTYANFGYVDMPFNCGPDIQYNFFHDKIKHVPASSELVDPMDLVQVTAATQAAYDANCVGNAVNWINALYQCPGIDPDNLSAVAEDLKNALIAICQAAADDQHPYGASTLPSSNLTGVMGPNGVAYFTFQDAIQDMLGIYPLDAEYPFCNAELISFPPPYDESMPAMGPTVVTSEVDPCTCTKLADYQLEFQAAAGSPAPGALNYWDAFAAYIAVEHQGSLTFEFQAIDGSPAPGTPGYWEAFAVFIAAEYPATLNGVQVGLLNDQCTATVPCATVMPPIAIPPFLVCGQCTTCEVVAALTLDFFGENEMYSPIPDDVLLTPNMLDDVQDQMQEQLVIHLNTALGYSLGFTDYYDFLVECTGNPELIGSLFDYGMDVEVECVMNPPNMVCASLLAAIELYNTNNSPDYPEDYDELALALNAQFGYQLDYAEYYEYVSFCQTPDYLESLGLERPEPFDCENLLGLVEAFNGCHDGAPNVEAYPCLLANYLNDVFHEHLSYLEYRNFILNCLGETATAALVGNDVPCVYEVTCQSVEAAIGFLELRKILRDHPNDFLEQVAFELNVVLHVTHDICWYYRVLSRCLRDKEIRTLLLNHSPVCEGTVPCGALQLDIQDYLNAVPGTPNPSPFPSNIETYLNGLYGINLQYCDYYLMLRDCAGEPTAQTLLGTFARCKDDDYTCYNLKQIVIAFNQDNTGAPNSMPNYQSLVTDKLNNVFGLGLRFCDYFRKYQTCYGLTAAKNKLGNNTGCVGEVDCVSLRHHIDRFVFEHPELKIGTAPFVSLMVSTLNDRLILQYTPCDYFLMSLKCLGERRTFELFRTKPCSDVGCDLCVDLLAAVQQFNNDPANAALLGRPEYALALSSYLNSVLGLSLTFNQFHAVLENCEGAEVANQLMGPVMWFSFDNFDCTVTYGDYPLYQSASANTAAELCNMPWMAIAGTVPIGDDCYDMQVNAAYTNALTQFNNYIEGVKVDFINEYTKHCLENAAETMSITKPDAQHHYTLYYYDAAGNLVQTVPPKGVETITNTFNVAAVDAARSALTVEAPVYAMPTQYRYNSYNQAVEQDLPDHDGTTRFWYDVKGRLVLSYNAQQFEDNKASYTLYDEQGRVKEVGQVNISTNGWPGSGTQTEYQGIGSIETYLAAQGGREQITRTYYDYIPSGTASTNIGSFLPGAYQLRNLRGRVAAVGYFSMGFYTGGLPEISECQSASFYSYDIAGNATTVFQYNRAMETAAAGQGLK